MYKLILSILFCIYLTGCVTPLSLDEQTPKVNYVENEKVLIGIVDERKKVKAGKADTFVGVAHSSFGIPINWHVSDILSTEKLDKKKNLSNWLEYRIVTGLNSKGWHAESVYLNNNESESEINSILKENEAKTLIKLTLHEWYFSINLNWVTAFNFDTDTTFDIYHLENGAVLTKQFKERDVIEESANESPQNNVLRAYRDQLEQMFNDPQIKEALERY